MKKLILSHRKTIATHSIAFILGFVIAYFIFTNTNPQKEKKKVLELENVKGQIKEKENNLVPVVDLKDELKSKEAEIEFLNDKATKLLNENEKLKKIKVANVSNLSDAELELFITEWAKRNGRLSQ